MSAQAGTQDAAIEVGQVLWTPPSDALEQSKVGAFMAWLAEHRGLRLTTHDELWQWSVDDLEGFWSAVWDYFEVISHAPYSQVLASTQMPGAEWFPGALLNYTEHALGRSDDADRIAVIGRSQTRPDVDLTFADLRDQVARARTVLAGLGVSRGDRVVGYVPNVPEALVAFLAPPASGRPGPAVRRSSGRAASSTVSPRSSRSSCWWPAATATGPRTSTAASRCAISGLACRRCAT